MPVKTKKWYHSKSVWSALVKALSGILASLVLVLNGDIELVEFLPGAITLVWGAIDVAIRYNTSQKIK